MTTWTLTATEPTAGPVYTANGYLGTSLPPDGGMLLSSTAAPCYIRGVYDEGPGGIDRLALFPCWNRLRYGREATIEGYRRELDLRCGLVRTEITLREERGLVHLEQTVLASRADPHLGAVQLRVRPEFDGEIVLLAGLEVPRDGAIEVLDLAATDRQIVLHGKVTTYGIEFGEVLTVAAPRWDLETQAAQMEASAAVRAVGRKGEALEVVQYARIVTSLESDEPAQSARAAPGDWKEVLAAHTAAWERLWQTDIEIDGDEEVQRFARAALYYLWSTMTEDDCWSIAPMGLSSNGYNGHIFWDAELWMYPSLLVTQPAMAHSCVAYRARTIGPARERAAANGHDGARYPWEAAFTGAEMTPHWAETRDLQLHITADVAIGQWWYYLATGDLAWLREHGWPVIRACAEYWVSRVEHNAALDRYEVSDVVCADEYAAHVNNDAFTNAAVAVALRIAARTARLAGEEPPPEWEHIAARMYIPYDHAAGHHLEYDGFNGELTKQADVELLAYPLEYLVDADQIARDLDYYHTVIDPDGPAMSFSTYAVISAQLGRAAEAYEYLRRSYAPNTRLPFYLFSETPTNNEYYFCTGIGGALQAFLFGFTGLRLREGHFHLDPILPPQWRSLSVRGLFAAGRRVNLTIDAGGVTICRQQAEGTVGMRIDRESGRVEPVGESGWQVGIDAEQGTDGVARLRLHRGGEVALDVAVPGRRLALAHEGVPV